MTELKISTPYAEFIVTPAAQEEQKYCFTQDMYSDARGACIGHLRGYWEGISPVPYTNWWPDTFPEKSSEFKEELSHLFHGLQSSGLLADRATMNARCNRFPSAVIKTQFRKEMAFRINTEHRIYFLRCIPHKGEYNFYLYCCDRNALMEIFRREKGLPTYCFSEHKTTHQVVVINYGESGYHPCKIRGLENIPTKELVDKLNAAKGISKAQVAAMECGSLLRWDCPAADPRNYTEEGLPIRTQSSAKEER